MLKERMADIIDEASRRMDEEIAAGITEASRAVALMPPGEAGECARCGYHYSRIVNGLCGYCRDGREPPDY